MYYKHELKVVMEYIEEGLSKNTQYIHKMAPNEKVLSCPTCSLRAIDPTVAMETIHWRTTLTYRHRASIQRPPLKVNWAPCFSSRSCNFTTFALRRAVQSVASAQLHKQIHKMQKRQTTSATHNPRWRVTNSNAVTLLWSRKWALMILTNSTAHRTRRFNTTSTRALQ